MPPSGKIFIPKTSTLAYLIEFFNCNFLALVDSEILGGSQIYTRGAYAPLTPPSGEISVQKASTSQYLIVFLISAFYI